MKPYIFALYILLLTACSATSPKNDYYTLSSPYAPGNGAAVSIHGENWKISSIAIPEMLNWPQIVIKMDANSVKILEYKRWAEPLDSMIYRVLSEDLRGKIHDNSSHTDVSEVSIAIDEFIADESGHVVLQVKWKVKRGNASSEYVFNQAEEYPAGNINAMVGAMSHLITSFADNIASKSID